jgi:hypothetical protein
MLADENARSPRGENLERTAPLCRLCKGVIEPGDAIIVIGCGTVVNIELCENVWHARCAPRLVRQYVPPGKGGFTIQ